MNSEVKKTKNIFFTTNDTDKETICRLPTKTSKDTEVYKKDILKNYNIFVDQDSSYMNVITSVFKNYATDKSGDI